MRRSERRALPDLSREDKSPALGLSRPINHTGNPRTKTRTHAPNPGYDKIPGREVVCGSLRGSGGSSTGYWWKIEDGRWRSTLDQFGGRDQFRARSYELDKTMR